MAVPPESVNLLAWINIFLESNEIMKDAQDIINDYPHVFGIEE